MTELEKATRMALEDAVETIEALLPSKDDENHDGHDARDVRKWRSMVSKLKALTQALATAEPLTLSDEWHERAFQAAKNYVNKGDKETRTACFIAGAMWSATTEPVADRCAQCKKAYRQNAASTGCPKCAPGVSVSEDEFQKPITTPERKGEPVAWMLWTHGPVLAFLNKDEAKLEFDRLNHAHPEPARKLIPLYTSPQVPEDVQRDAERYRWLRAKENANRDEWNLFGPYSTPAQIDAAIDAARKGE